MLLLQLEATDEDSGELGNVTYTILSGDDDGVFDIGFTSGELYVTEDVDREVRDSFTLTVMAQDGGLHKLYWLNLKNINYWYI